MWCIAWHRTAWRGVPCGPFSHGGGPPPEFGQTTCRAPPRASSPPTSRVGGHLPHPSDNTPCRAPPRASSPPTSRVGGHLPHPSDNTPCHAPLQPNDAPPRVIRHCNDSGMQLTSYALFVLCGSCSDLCDAARHCVVRPSVAPATWVCRRPGRKVTHASRRVFPEGPAALSAHPGWRTTSENENPHRRTGCSSCHVSAIIGRTSFRATALAARHIAEPSAAPSTITEPPPSGMTAHHAHGRINELPGALSLADFAAVAPGRFHLAPPCLSARSDLRMLAPDGRTDPFIPASKHSAR